MPTMLDLLGNRVIQCLRACPNRCSSLVSSASLVRVTCLTDLLKDRPQGRDEHSEIVIEMVSVLFQAFFSPLAFNILRIFLDPQVSLQPLQQRHTVAVQPLIQFSVALACASRATPHVFIERWHQLNPLRSHTFPSRAVSMHVPLKCRRATA